MCNNTMDGTGSNNISFFLLVLLQAVYMSLPCAHESSLSVLEGWRSGQPHSHCVWSCSLFIIQIVVSFRLDQSPPTTKTFYLNPAPQYSGVQNNSTQHKTSKYTIANTKSHRISTNFP
jgi:hypothetical protein